MSGLSSAPFETAVLTVTFYGIMVMMLSMFIVVSQSVFIDSVKTRLGEVSNHVAEEIVYIYSMCKQLKTGKQPIPILQLLEIPHAVSEQGYAVELKNIDGVWFVAVYLEFNMAINASTPIFTDAPEDVTLEIGQGELQIGSYLVGYDGGVVHSGSKAAVWGVKHPDDRITIGLGWLGGG
ncbi:MAG: hypothetical protein ACUVQ0_04065 [Thermoproteota archaeon]